MLKRMKIFLSFPKITRKNVLFLTAILIFLALIALLKIPHNSQNSIVIERTQNTNVIFLGKDNEGKKKYRTEISLGVINFRDAEGNWKEYNTQLVPAKKEGYDYQLASSDHQALFKKKTSSAPITIEKDGQSLTMAPGVLQYINEKGETQIIAKPIPNPKIQIKNHVITYTNIYGNGIDLRFINTPEKVAKELVIHSKEALPNPRIENPVLEFTMNVTTPKNIAIHVPDFTNPLGSKIQWDRKKDVEVFSPVEFRENSQNKDRNYDNSITADDHIVFAFLPATAYDSSPTPNILYSTLENEERLSFTLSPTTENTLQASVKTPYTWVQNAQFPVIIDPTTSFNIAASANDGLYISNSTLHTNLDYSAAGRCSNLDYNGYFRFTNVTIPEGSTVDSAEIHITPRYSSAGTGFLSRIIGEATTNPDNPSSYADVTGRTRTSASVNWNTDTGFTENTPVNSPDASDVIQEIIDQAGWESGNALMLFWENQLEGAACNLRYAATYDHVSYAEPELEITYTEGVEDVSEDSLIAYWKFDEGNGTTVKNSSSQGKTYDGSIIGATWTNNGKLNKALNFDGDDYVEISGLMGSPTAVTLTGWANLTAADTSGAEIISLGDAVILRLDDAPGTTGYYYNGSDWIETTAGTFHEGTGWHHYAYVVDPANSIQQLYIDGKLVASDSESTAISYSGQGSNTRIGSHANGSTSYDFTGTIDEVKVYNTALSSDEIKIDFNLGKAVILGYVGTDASGNPSMASDRYYCPPGDTTASCAPIGQWNFEEGTGQTINDTSGSGNSGTLNDAGPGRWITGKIGKALRFYNNTSENVNFGDIHDFDDGQSFSISGWVRDLTSGDNSTVIAKKNGSNSTQSGFSLAINPSELLIFRVSDGSNQCLANSDTGLTINQWYHFTAVFEDSTTDSVKMYINGALKDTDCEIDLGNIGGPNLRFGSESDQQVPFSGDLDNIRIYNYALSPAQVAWEYNYGKPTVHYKFDECQGTTLYDTSKTRINGTIVIGGSGSQSTAGNCETASTAWGNGASGKRNYSLNFDGTDDYISFDPTNAFTTTTGTISFWIKTSSTQAAASGYYLFGHPRTSDHSRIYIRTSSDGAALNASLGDGTAISINAIIPNQWYHAVLTWDGTSAGFYINGDDVTDISTFNGLTALNSTAFIGCLSTATQCATGQIDDFQTFNYSLTAQQIKTLYNQGAIRYGPVTGTP